jgi:radical SAM protein with 4Fe4S-binding SPASM domain
MSILDSVHRPGHECCELIGGLRAENAKLRSMLEEDHNAHDSSIRTELAELRADLALRQSEADNLLANNRSLAADVDKLRAELAEAHDAEAALQQSVIDRTTESTELRARNVQLLEELAKLRHVVADAIFQTHAGTEVEPDCIECRLAEWCHGGCLGAFEIMEGD